MNDQIIALYKEGKSFSEIAAECGKSKGQVAGIIYRYRKPKKEPAPKIEQNRPVVVKKERISLMELDFDSCRFPIESRDNEHWFCGSQITKGSYCEKHHAITHSAAHISLKSRGHYR